MEISGEYHIARDREAVWAALNDPDMLQKCIPGCEALEQTGDHSYSGRIRTAIGPVRATFGVNLKLENLQPPERYTLVGDSKGGAAGFARGAADVELVANGAATALRYSAEFKVGGKLAQVGSRLVLGATRKTADDFFGCLARELGEARPPEQPLRPVPERFKLRTKAWLAAGLGAVIILLWWFLLR